MLAKLTVRARTWDEAVDRMIRCLDEFVIRGVKTTIPFHRRVMEDPVFRRGEFTTRYIDERMNELSYVDDRHQVDRVLAIVAAIVARAGL